MEKSRLEIKVGLFVLIGLVLLAVLLVQFSKGTSLFRGTYTLNLHTKNVGGLKQRSGVLLSGVQVGGVERITLAPDGKSVTVTLRIYNDFPIYTNAVFLIEQAGFLGDQFVSVIPGVNNVTAITNNSIVTFQTNVVVDVLANNADVQCRAPFNLQDAARNADDLITSMKETAATLKSSVNDLYAHVLNAQTLSSFGTSLTNLRVFTEQAIDAVKNINGIVATNGSQVSIAVSNAVNFTAALNQLADSAQVILATNGVNVTAATKNIEDLTVTFKQLAADLQAGKGLAGTVLQNQQLATNISAIAANLSVTTSNLNRLGLWGILWSHKPETTNSRAATTNTNILYSPRNHP